MKSPVLFMIFKREDTTRRVFERIREAQPPRLYIAADGPRRDRPDEVEKCAATRKVVEHIDWPCEVHHLFRDENLGCGKGVSSAISWFFEHEEQGIIIEDDILPHIDFFRYCDEMLERYKDDEKVQLISGRNAFFEGYFSVYSYYYSSLFHIWGWASWRRVWTTYQFDANLISKDLFTESLHARKLPGKTIRFWMDIFDTMRTSPIDTWDYQLYFNQIVYGRYSLIPYINQTENIGFDSIDATHTQEKNDRNANHKAHTIYPVKYVEGVYFDEKADTVFAENFGFVKLSLLYRLKRKIFKIFGAE